MNFEKELIIPSLKAHFTISASNQILADKIAKDAEETIEYAGINAGIHFLKGIKGEEALVMESRRTPINSAPLYECEY